MEYEQRVIIKFLTNESVDAHEIHTRLSAQFGEQTYALRAIQFWAREMQRGREDLQNDHRSKRRAFNCIDTKIISILEKAPFESARSIAQVLNMEHATMLHRLQKKAGIQILLSSAGATPVDRRVRAKHKEFLGRMIPDPEAERKGGWKYLVTCNKSWFFLLSGRRRRWGLAKGEVVANARIHIQNKKVMFPIMYDSI
jgi:hypothetical protein